MRLVDVRGRDDLLHGELAQIADETLGDGVYDRPALRALAEQPTATVIAAVSVAGVIGWACGEELAVGGTWYAQFGEVARAWASRPHTINLRDLAVAPASQGRGVGRALAEAVLAWARRRGARSALSVAWLSPAPRTSAPLFERLGFQRLGVAAAPYDADSRERGWTCPFCGQPCRCPAACYGLVLA